MPSAREFYRADILLAWYGTIDTARAYGHLNPYFSASFTIVLGVPIAFKSVSNTQKVFGAPE